MNHRADIFNQHRPRLYGIAYRMLGSRSDAEDMLQDAYLRWHNTDLERVQTPEAWLTTTITRLCIDRLRAARIEREKYSGPWLPEPLISDEAPPADHAADLESDLSMAFMIMLERLAPEERAAFLLHDVFEREYAEIARILDKTEASCRQIVHRARERVRRDKPRFTVNETAHRQLLARFIEGLQSGDMDALAELFAEEATWTADGGGNVPATSRTLTGGARIAKLMAGLSRTVLHTNRGKFEFRLASINGETGVIAFLDGRLFWALSLETDGARILAGYNVINPDKLAGIEIPDSRH